MPKAKRDAMSGATDTKFKREMEDEGGPAVDVCNDLVCLLNSHRNALRR